MVEWIYFHDARNAEQAPTIAKKGMEIQEYITNIVEKSTRNGAKSENNGCDRINESTTKKVRVANVVATVA
jgi:hypothetical protein